MDPPGLLRSYHITRDQQATVVERAIQLRGGATEPTGPATVERDWLADPAAGGPGAGERGKVAGAARWLRRHAPEYRPYQALDGKTLADWLDRIEVPVTWPSRQPTVV